MNRAKLIDYLKLIAFVLCFAGIPLAMVIAGYYYTLIKNNNIYEKSVFREISNYYTRLESISDQEKFWYYLFDNRINKNTKKGNTTKESLKNLASELKTLKKDYDFDYIVYHTIEGAIPSITSTTLGGVFEEWKIALKIVWSF
ncbi:MAG: hypothetical protein J6Z11_14305, partial [Candidatus Riflebacteria bacterium]|nr:hypothetical protein [Candidatus Riflebacteria bacterium]